ncbi:hypothetical protein [Streptosporangium roseum]|uniref:hypothetical protein n=1 Tax=Streptosporangium roseum TaxID=2001 RepID=UPI000AC752D1|nr:hypothetical protein [Streptosporangium roseum]
MTDAELGRMAEKLGLEQKVRLLTGATVWRTHAEPDIGLRAMVTSVIFEPTLVVRQSA